MHQTCILTNQGYHCKSETMNKNS